VEQAAAQGKGAGHGDGAGHGRRQTQGKCVVAQHIDKEAEQVNVERLAAVVGREEERRYALPDAQRVDAIGAFIEVQARRGDVQPVDAQEESS
ncbi:MAG TPA: hypothetical protein P5333_00210, partial [Caldilinea sp.]|nr:hypothetical protein [Caldilinea sp.]